MQADVTRNDVTLTEAQMRKALLRPTLEASVGVTRSYWRQVGGSLIVNPRAVAAMAVLLLLVLAAAVGPLVYAVDPARLALGAAAEGPSRAHLAWLVKDPGSDKDIGPWQVLAPAQGALLPAAQLPAVTLLQVVSANTERVRLRFEQVPGAARYTLYRQSHPPRDRADLGLPLGSTFNPRQVSFEDRLLLRHETLYYSVVASDGIDEAPVFTVVAVTPAPAIGWLEAQLQGLVPAQALPEAWPATQVRLAGHPLGTDYLGRDLLARLLVGARTSLFIAVSAAFLFTGVGALYGAAAGFIGGGIDNALMRFADFVVALPFLLFMILLRIAFGIGPGESGVTALVVALLLLSWPASARLVRAQVLQLREEAFVEAARLSGASSAYIIARHMLPSGLPVILVALTFAIPQAIFTEAFLSFIGMGVTPPTPSWGSMSNDGIRNLLVHPAELWWPALCISATVLAFNVLGDALRDALDVNVQGRL